MEPVAAGPRLHVLLGRDCRTGRSRPLPLYLGGLELLPSFLADDRVCRDDRGHRRDRCRGHRAQLRAHCAAVTSWRFPHADACQHRQGPAGRPIHVSSDSRRRDAVDRGAPRMAHARSGRLCSHACLFLGLVRTLLSPAGARANRPLRGALLRSLRRRARGAFGAPRTPWVARHRADPRPTAPFFFLLFTPFSTASIAGRSPSRCCCSPQAMCS